MKVPMQVVCVVMFRVQDVRDCMGTYSQLMKEGDFITRSFIFSLNVILKRELDDFYSMKVKTK